MSELKLFEKNEWKVRVIEKEDGLWFVASDVCRSLGIGNVGDSLRRLSSDEKNTIDLIDGNRGNPNQAIVSESGFYALIISSRKPEAQSFRKWVTGEVLPSIQRTGSYSLKPTSQFLEWDKATAVMRFTFDALRLPDSGKLFMLRKACKECNMPSSFLPDYCEEQVTQSATTLLKKFNSELSTAVFNQNMKRLGFLTLSSRTSSKGGLKHYWSITEKGLTYGKNLISEKNPRETQPHWYEDTFPRLLQLFEGDAHE